MARIFTECESCIYEGYGGKILRCRWAELIRALAKYCGDEYICEGYIPMDEVTE